MAYFFRLSLKFLYLPKKREIYLSNSFKKHGAQKNFFLRPLAEVITPQTIEKEVRHRLTT